MALVRNLLVLFALGAGAMVAHAADNAYVVSYIETLPAASAKAAALIRKFSAASRKEAGFVGMEVLQRINQPDQYVLLETWANLPAAEAHAKADGTRKFREQLKPLLRAPYDERPHIVLDVGPAKPVGGKGAIYTVTHVDVIGPAKDPGTAAVKELSLASRGDPGNLRFDSLTQTSRPNHMTLIEVWKDRKAIEAHSTAAHMTAFREKLAPLAGALLDERFYKKIN